MNETFSTNQRERFELWARSAGMGVELDGTMYASRTTRAAWRSYQNGWQDRGAPEPSGWQPIEAAPKDARDGILLWVPYIYQGKGGTKIGVFIYGTWHDDVGIPVRPSHWMPLPAGPQVATTEKR